MENQRDIKEILSDLRHDGAAFRLRGLAYCIGQRLNRPEVVKEIKALTKDGVLVLGHTIADYAIAALDILGIEKYIGNSDGIKSLISSLPDSFNLV